MSLTSIPQNATELNQVWQGLSLPRKIGLGALVGIALASLIFFANWIQTPDYVAAFTDLTAEDGAAILEYLKENNIPYEISNNSSTIKVPADQVHEIRLTLAGQGLPNQGMIGMELFDGTNLAMTEFVQQVNYQRALEGELARTIGSLTSVKSARVHVVIPQPTLFSEEENHTTASVVLDLEPGRSLNREQIQAITHLVSSAVEGLSPSNLTIVDMDGNVLADGIAAADTAPVVLNATQLEIQRSVEKDLEQRIGSMLEKALGPNRAVVRLSAELNWDQVETQNELYYPGNQTGVLRSSRYLTETYPEGYSDTGGVPGTDTNIADTTTAPTYQTGITNTNGTYNRIDLTNNYEVSRTASHIISATGQIKRLSVSVLIDNITDTVTISAIEQATIAAAGLSLDRGDTLIVNSIPFDRSLQLKQEVEIQTEQQRDFYLQIAKWVVIGVIVAIIFFSTRNLLRSLQQQQKPAPKISETSMGSTLLEEVKRINTSNNPEDISLDLGTIGPPTFSEAQQANSEKHQMLRQLQIVAKSRPETLAQIIQFWLTEDGK